MTEQQLPPRYLLIMAQLMDQDDVTPSVEVFPFEDKKEAEALATRLREGLYGPHPCVGVMDLTDPAHYDNPEDWREYLAQSDSDDVYSEYIEKGAAGEEAEAAANKAFDAVMQRGEE